MMRFYAQFITEATPQVIMALRSERAMVGRRQKKIIFYFGEHLISIITTEIAGMRPSTVLCPMRRKAAKIISHLGINEPESNRRSLSLKLTNTNEMGVRLS